MVRPGLSSGGNDVRRKLTDSELKFKNSVDSCDYLTMLRHPTQTDIKMKRQKIFCGGETIQTNPNVIKLTCCLLSNLKAGGRVYCNNW